MPIQTLNTTSQIVLIIHGFATPAKRYSEIKKIAEESYPNARIIIPDFSLPLVSTSHPNKIVNILLQEVDKAWEEISSKQIANDPLPEIIFIGHSAGCLLARKLYIVACGESRNCPFENSVENKNTKIWAKQVVRIVLIAGINNGWTTTQHLNNKRSIGIGVGIMLGHFIQFFTLKKPFAFHIRKGSTFISNLRLQWIWMKKEALGKKIPEPLTIQLLGTIDDIVPPENNIDIFTGLNFVYLEVPYSGHINVLDMDASKMGISNEELHERKARAAVMKDSLLKSKGDLLEQQKNTVGEMACKVDYSITDVVFVIHGIRDTAYWTQKLANRIRSYGNSQGRKFATETSTYGYFSMLQFILLGRRIAKMEWLVDQYIENLALYPNAHDSFSFFGHSNGTYLLAAAFKRYPAIKFKNVILAGSVVQQKFYWDKLKRKGRISNFLNLVATADWVVGIFPKAFERIPWMDLGSGGFDGFKKIPVNNQVKYLKGGHGEGTNEKYWNEIAYFIVQGTSSDKATAFVPFSRPLWSKAMGFSAPIPLLAGFALIFMIGYFIFQHLPESLTLENKILIELLYVFLIWKLITKF